MEIENNKNNTAKDDSKTSLNVGALLIEARSNLSLSVDDIANELRLSVEVIEKIERNQSDMDLPTAFVRGYIKSYATFVGLDTEPLLSHFDRDFNAISPSLKSVQSISRFESNRKEVNSTSGVFKGLTLFIIVVFLTLASWEVWNRYQPQNENSNLDHQIDLNVQGYLSEEMGSSLDSSNASQQIADPNSGALSLEQIKPASDSNAEFDGADDLANNADPSQPEQGIELSDMSPKKSITGLDSTDDTRPDASIEAQANKEQTLEFSDLVLDFSEQCWVEIIDSRGEILANGIKQAGKHMPLKGVAPIKVVLGNPNAVSMIYQGEAFTIRKYQSGARAIITLQ